MRNWRHRLASAGPIAASLVLHSGAVVLLSGTATPVPLPREPVPVVSVRLFANKPAAALPTHPAITTSTPKVRDAPNVPTPERPLVPPTKAPRSIPPPERPQMTPSEGLLEPRPVEVAARRPVAPLPAERMPGPEVPPRPEQTRLGSKISHDASTASPQIAATQRADYAASVRALILAQRRYPSIARRRTIEGRVSVWIQIGSDGTVVDIDFVSLAPKILETATSRAIDHAAPFPRPPGGPVTVEIDLDYRLRDSS